MLVEAVAPARLGSGFRWLIASSWATNLTDGVRLAAGPLLVAAKTDDPFVVSLAATLGWLPPLLVGLYAGALSDRRSRKAVIVGANLVRAVVLAGVVAALLLDAAPVALVLGGLFLLGLSEVFADNATSTLLPMLVGRDDLPIANARLMFGFITLNQLAGAPVGAALFVAGQAWPFVVQVVLVLLAAALVTRIALPERRRGAAPAPMRHDIAEGVRWLRSHPAVRMLALTVFVFNITYGAAWSVLVLYAAERLDLGAIGFGLITTVIAVGGVASTLGYGWVVRRVDLGTLMRVCLVTETLVMLVLALTTWPWLAAVAFLCFGAEAFAWATTSVSVRQRVVPAELMGRVGSVYVLAVSGGLVLGALVGGVLADRLGVTAPYWFAFVGGTLALPLIWRSLGDVAHDQP